MSITPEQLKENRLKWIEALESGKYKRGSYRLCDGGSNTFCCLGVAREIFNGEEENEAGHLYLTGHLLFLKKESLSLSDTFGQGGGIQAQLTFLNDTQGLTFSEIAVILRKHWGFPVKEN